MENKMIIRMFLYLLICVSLAIAQSVQDVVIERVTTSEDGEFFFPKFTPEGRGLVFTKANYTGLYIRYFSNPEIQELNSSPGAGYNPLISADGTRVFYQTNKYISGRRYTSLEMLNLQTMLKVTIERNGRHQVLPRKVIAGNMTYQKDDRLYSFNTADLKSKTFEINGADPMLTIEKGNMVLYHGNIKKKLEPLGIGHYIWPSLSPDKKKLLFTKSGDGTYISDLNGKIEVSFGYANAPEWSADGQWIVYMDDKDDGHQYISSEIYITSVDGKKRFQISEGKSIDMFPVWSPDGKQVAYHTTKGGIYIAHLSFGGDDQ